MTQIKIMGLLLVSTLAHANPDTIINNLTFQQYNAQGQLAQTLHAKNIEHQPNEKQIKTSLG